MAFTVLSQQLPNYAKGQMLPIFLWMRLITGRLAKIHRTNLGTAKRNVGLQVSLYSGGMPDASSFAMASQIIGQFTSVGKKAVRAEMLQKPQDILNNMEEKDREALPEAH